nr:hypothetical protein [Lysinibacillus timonensis]
MVSTSIENNIQSKSLVGYAVLAENLDSSNSSFLDNFLPLIRQGVSDIEGEFTIAELSIYLDKNFGLQFPFHVLDYSLRKLSRKNILQFNKTNNSYSLLKKELTNIIDKRNQTLTQYHTFILAMKEYFRDYFEESYSNDELERMLETFLNISLDAHGRNSLEINNDNKQALFLVGKFIRHIEKKEILLFNLYQNIYIGNMISAAMYFTQPDRYTQKFKNTSVYFDTTLLIFALGYAGEARAEPTRQLIKILKSQHAQLRSFSHTVEEVKGVLSSCLRKFENGMYDRFGTVEYFISKNYSPSEIMTIINAVEKDIVTKLNIKIVDKPNYSDTDLFKYNINLVEYANLIGNKITYNFEDSLNKDLDSLNAIYRLRKDELSNSIESCRAIFVTNNNKLANIVKDKFIADYHKPDYVPPFISDYVLTTLQWIKSPNTEVTLPKKMIIANCIAATQPSEKMLQKYLERIEKERELGKISEEDFALLRTDSEARSIMMDRVKGNEEQIIYLDCKELAEMTMQRKMEEHLNVITQQKTELENLKLQNNNTQHLVEKKERELVDKDGELQSYKNTQIEKIKSQSLKIATKLTNFLTILLILLFVTWFAIAYNSNSNKPFITQVFIKWVVPIAGVLGVGILNLIKPIKAKSINFLSKKISQFLNRFL